MKTASFIQFAIGSLSLFVAVSSAYAQGGRLSFSGAVTTATCQVQPATQSQEGMAIQLDHCHSSIAKVNTYVQAVGTADSDAAGSKLQKVTSIALTDSAVHLQGGQAQLQYTAALLNKMNAASGAQGKMLMTTEYQ